MIGKEMWHKNPRTRRHCTRSGHSRARKPVKTAFDFSIVKTETDLQKTVLNVSCLHILEKMFLYRCRLKNILVSGIYQLTPFSHLGITFPNLFIAGSVQLNWWHISYLKWVSTATPNEYSFYFTVIVICVFLFILIVTPSRIYWWTE